MQDPQPGNISSKGLGANEQGNLQRGRALGGRLLVHKKCLFLDLEVQCQIVFACPVHQNVCACIQCVCVTYLHVHAYGEIHVFIILCIEQYQANHNGMCMYVFKECTSRRE